MLFFIDLTPLTVKDESKKVYELKDGDIPCTPEKEPNYNYVFNFCGDVTTASFPKTVCSDIQMGSAIQYIDRSDGYKECNVIGHYDPERDDTYFSLLDAKDPSKGVAMTYQYGQKCPSGKLRTATINVQCANVKYVEDSANEPTECDYHVTMRSMYGCPTVRTVCYATSMCLYYTVLCSALHPLMLYTQQEYTHILSIDLLNWCLIGVVSSHYPAFLGPHRSARSRRAGCATRTGTAPMTARPRARTATATR